MVTQKILVTGCAGFIGSHTCEYLLKRGDQVLGIDNLNDYYDVERKKENLTVLMKYKNFEFRKEDICNTNSISEWKPDRDRNLLLAEVRDCTISGPRNPVVVCFTSLLSSLTAISSPHPFCFLSTTHNLP